MYLIGCLLVIIIMLIDKIINPEQYTNTTNIGDVISNIGLTLSSWVGLVWIIVINWDVIIIYATKISSIPITNEKDKKD